VKNIVNIINEEILKLEGVADTYGEKFGLRNTAKEMDRKATAGIPPTPNMGEFIGDVVDEDYFYGNDDDDTGPVDTKLSRVFKNPPSLQKFEPDVRAISDEEGNLFVAETDGRFYHTNLEHTVLGSGRYKGYDFIQWYRVNTTDEFRLANSYGSFAPALAWKDLVAQVNVLKEKQPYQFRNAVNTFESIVKEEIEKLGNNQHLNQNFYDWFGNSDVVNNDGSPTIVYHGTDSNFTEFDSSFIGKTPYAHDDHGLGFFFANNKDFVKQFGSNIVGVYLRIENPLYVDYDEYVKNIDGTHRGEYPSYNGESFKKYVIKDGYDGIIITGWNPRTIMYVVFEPTQIKSATGNNGEFSPSNPDITKESLGETINPALKMTFNPKKTGMPYYDEILNADDDLKNYFFFNKNVWGKVVKMTPQMYMDECKKRMGDGYDGINPYSRETIIDAVKQGKPIDMPVLNYVDGNFAQEGRNRAYIAKQLGVEVIPVFVLKSVPEEVKEKKIEEILSDAKTNTGSSDPDKLREYIAEKYGWKTANYLRYDAKRLRDSEKT
jgi:hypothetical protein